MTRCQKHTRIGRTTMKLGMDTIFGMANSIPALPFEIDAFFSKYSYNMTRCEKHTRISRKRIKFRMDTLFGMANSIQAFCLEVDALFSKYPIHAMETWKYKVYIQYTPCKHVNRNYISSTHHVSS